MNRRTLLRKLSRLWEKEGTLSAPVNATELLDDCATLGLEGASQAYVQNLDDGMISRIPPALTK